ncbi:DUF2163 domain-containing protein [Sphingomonas aracearum]|uniref:DUF2163 domain-containing protein n=1 Tax=Sphingomonas aracearum TaxID=2283317 RepID=A0A369VS09_9SPHN|nr:DUF2163 domain-containing protein [Sphingomonas aracearum]RDE04813.1 DUF2163 domain-containing protein [Sphingomonas aracearum]
MALFTTALCWRIARGDGVTIGLTSHDRDLEVGGLLYRASPGMTPSAVKRSDGLEADTMDVSGALSSAAIGEADLLAGRWDGARVTLFAVDWTGGDPVEMGPVEIGCGSIGAVETRGGAFSAELRGAAAAFEAAVAEATSAGCRAELGDRRCRVAMAGRRMMARVVGSEGELLTLDRAEPVAGGWGGGRLRWFGGANSGLAGWIAGSVGARVTLRSAPVLPVAAGDLVEVSEGCDKRLETCAGRFANVANFRGEPFLPGMDLLTRYPGG